MATSLRRYCKFTMKIGKKIVTRNICSYRPRDRAGVS